MDIAVLGASGRLGKHLLSTALGRGHTVRALTRRPARIKHYNENLTVFRGDAVRGTGLSELLDGCRRIVWAMQPRDPARAMLNLLSEIGGRSIERLVFLSWVGVGDSASQARRTPEFLDRLLPRVRARMIRRVEEAEELLRSSGLPYVVLRTTRLTEARGAQTISFQGPAGIPPLPIGRAEMARFVLRVLENRSWVESEVTVGRRR
jgi:uncharacterized protein YbjT (DUF2867 family)